MTYIEEKEIRVAEFQRHLELMVQRRRDERRMDCAITFTEDRPDECETPALRTAVRKAAPVMCWLADWVADRPAGVDVSGGESVRPAGDEGAGGRYVQFAFMQKTFYMDLPRETLSADEGRRLVECRSGFFRLRDRRALWMSHESWCRTWEESGWPICRVRQGKERMAKLEELTRGAAVKGVLPDGLVNVVDVK